jgi:hypothetical protein
MDLPNRKPDIQTSIPAGRGPWLRVTANMLEEKITQFSVVLKNSGTI